MNALVVVLALAQQFLPAGPVVRGGLADAREPRVAIGVISTDLLSDELAARPGQAFPATEDNRRDVEGVVELGTNFPLVRLGAVIVSLQGGVSSRFRLERADNDALSIDYMVAFPFSYTHGDTEARVRLIHRSAHLGDEVVLNAGLRRLEFDHEEADALVARTFGPLRVYGGGTLTLASSFDKDRWGVQAGAEFRGKWGSGRALEWEPRLGVDWQRHSIADGNSRLSVAAGLELEGDAGAVALDFVYAKGATALGELFLDRETYGGLRLTLRRSNHD